jgi:hypothetical protein
VEGSDSHTHARDRPATGASLNRLDDPIAHAKFMHLSSVLRRALLSQGNRRNLDHRVLHAFDPPVPNQAGK